MSIHDSLSARNSLQSKDSLWNKCGVKTIDHFAVTTRDLDAVLNDYMGLDGCELLRGPGTNSSQNVDYAFIRTAQGMTVEILGIRNDSPISEHVKNGGGAYHLCFAVNDLDEAVKIARDNGAIKVVEQRQDDAFDGRRVAFLMHPDHGLFEFLEAYPHVVKNSSDDKRDESTGISKQSNDFIKNVLSKAFARVFPGLDAQDDIERAQLGVTPDWNSLNQLQLVMEIEKLANIKFSVDEITSTACYQDFVVILTKKVD